MVSGKPKLQGMPQIRVNENESETLEVICEDDRAGIRLFLIIRFLKITELFYGIKKVEKLWEADRFFSEHSEYVSGTSGRRV